MNDPFHQKDNSFSNLPPKYSAKGPLPTDWPNWNNDTSGMYKAMSSRSLFGLDQSPGMAGPPRKRPRSFTKDNIPTIPQISGEAILDIYTHKSLHNINPPSEEFGGNERLAELGSNILEAAVSSALFHRRPCVPARQMKAEREDAISDSNIDHWLTIYNLRDKVRCLPSLKDTLKSPQESRIIFTSYVGAVFVQQGMEIVQKWISALIEPEPTAGDSKRVKNEPTPLSVPPVTVGFMHASNNAPPQPSNPPPPLPKSANPSDSQIAYLPLFNQTANQRRLGVDYVTAFFGPPHAGRWTAKCMVNGLEKGQGMGSSKQLAKEEAAKQAYYAMGWSTGM